MLWIRKEEVFPQSDYGASPQRCREHDLNGICGDVCREDLEAPPPLFCHPLCLVLCLAKVYCPLGDAQDHLEAWNGRFTGRCIAKSLGRQCAARLQCLDPTGGSLFQESLLDVHVLSNHIKIKPICSSRRSGYVADHECMSLCPRML